MTQTVSLLGNAPFLTADCDFFFGNKETKPEHCLQQVTPAHIAEVVSRATGIPATRLISKNVSRSATCSFVCVLYDMREKKKKKRTTGNAAFLSHQM